MKRKKSLIFKMLLITLLVGAAIFLYVGFDIYSKIFRPNISLGNKGEEYFYIHTGSNYQQVIDSLVFKGYVINRNSFDWVADKKQYKNRVRPGRYKITSGMNNQELVNLLRSGVQDPLRLTIQNYRTIDELAGFLSRNLETDSISFIHLFSNQDTLIKYGFTNENVLCMFLANTYEFYWNTSAYQFFRRMHKEYHQYWNETRIQRLSSVGLSKVDVCVLASIVQQETVKRDEKSLIAGVYMNRLKRKMALQSDPTLLYALNDYSIRRVLNIHKQIESPYNTYKYAGLPPGPITMPDLSTQNAVMNYERHNYLFFCAREDFSGYHNFAETYDQHLIFARRYQKTLDTLKIFN
jgi:UPF0755 protein